MSAGFLGASLLTFSFASLLVARALALLAGFANLPSIARACEYRSDTRTFDAGDPVAMAPLANCASRNGRGACGSSRAKARVEEAAAHEQGRGQTRAQRERRESRDQSAT